MSATDIVWLVHDIIYVVAIVKITKCSFCQRNILSNSFVPIDMVLNTETYALEEPKIVQAKQNSPLFISNQAGRDYLRHRYRTNAYEEMTFYRIQAVKRPKTSMRTRTSFRLTVMFAPLIQNFQFQNRSNFAYSNFLVIIILHQEVELNVSSYNLHSILWENIPIFWIEFTLNYDRVLGTWVDLWRTSYGWFHTDRVLLKEFSKPVVTVRWL